MSSGGGREGIRVLYLTRGRDLNPFTARLLADSPDINVTMATQPEEVTNILRGGFDCLVIEEGKPLIDGDKITRAVRSGGFIQLPVILHREGREDARGLAEAIRRTRRAPQAAIVERKGFPSSPIGN